jgi:2-oxoglutarate dehydrogenase E2 component (dihydrolipoamide succinyltransferase)
MTVEIKVPQMGESITEGIVARWLKAEGDAVEVDEPVIEVETDKITVEVPAPGPGVLSKQNVQEGDTVRVGQVLGEIAEGEGKKHEDAPATDKADPSATNRPQARDAEPPSPKKEPPKSVEKGTTGNGRTEWDSRPGASTEQEAQPELLAMPAARAEAQRRGVSLQAVTG